MVKKSKMRRLEGSFGSRDPEEDRRKSRESVLASLVVFASLVVAIRVAPVIINSM